MQPLAGPAHRYTPTCVGKTIVGSEPKTRDKVHPHVCGENGYIGDGEVGEHGYTPTCVGKTQLHPQSPGRQPVHPHVCGENCAM